MFVFTVVFWSSHDTDVTVGRTDAAAVSGNAVLLVPITVAPLLVTVVNVTLPETALGSSVITVCGNVTVADVPAPVATVPL